MAETPPNRMHLAIMMHNIIGGEMQRQSELGLGYIDLRNVPDLLLSAFDAAGLTVVPKEPTAGMLGAGYKRVRAYDIYFPDMSGNLASIIERMVAASPYAARTIDDATGN